MQAVYVCGCKTLYSITVKFGTTIFFHGKIFIITPLLYLYPFTPKNKKSCRPIFKTKNILTLPSIYIFVLPSFFVLFFLINQNIFLLTKFNANIS